MWAWISLMKPTDASGWKLTEPCCLVSTFPARRTHLILWHAVDTHGGDGCEHHSDGEQTEELAGDGVSRVLQRQPQTLPDVPITHFLEVLHVSAKVEKGSELIIYFKKGERKCSCVSFTCLSRISRPQMCLHCWRRSHRPSYDVGCSPVCGRGNGNYSNCPGRTHWCPSTRSPGCSGNRSQIKVIYAVLKEKYKLHQNKMISICFFLHLLPMLLVH